MFISYYLVSFVHLYGGFISSSREVYLGFNDRSWLLWVLRSLVVLSVDELFIFFVSCDRIFTGIIIFEFSGDDILIGIFIEDDFDGRIFITSFKRSEQITLFVGAFFYEEETQKKGWNLIPRKTICPPI